MKELVKRLRQFSTASGVSTLIFIGTLFGIESEVIQAGVGVLTAVLALYDVVRDEKE